MNIISLFAGCGGLDLGFHRAGFKTIWANEYDRTIWDTYEYNFPDTVLDKRSIVDVPSNEIPDNIDGIIGGPPCQSWSEAGAGRGINDSRGQLFYEYIRILKDKQPKFFLAENVAGILFDKHTEAFNAILESFDKVGYTVSVELLNTKNFNVPQDRKRVIIIGYRKDLNQKFLFPEQSANTPTLYDSISDLDGLAKPALDKNKTNGRGMNIHNHEYMTGGWSTMFMSRNRVRSWKEPSFTIQASGRHAPIHPSAPKMEKVATDVFIFKKGAEKKYRRLTIRECARVQTFPDDHKFIYHALNDGYKMVGNAVPVEFAKSLAQEIYNNLHLKYDDKLIYELQEQRVSASA